MPSSTIEMTEQPVSKTQNMVERKEQKKKHARSVWGIGNKVKEKSVEYVKSKDSYGQPVQLFYKGDDTFKTCPGGCISIFIIFTMFCYTVLKFKAMILYEDWEVSSS